jgi:four helix bundle suffix protein
MTEIETLLPQHSGYRNLKSFQVSQLVYDITVRFVDRYVDKYSRTRDQMVQAARSGVQNIAEGSASSATSKKTELKLTNVARASLEELRLDYEDFLRQSNLTQWPSTLSTLYPEITANAALVLINVASTLLNRQINTLARKFETEGGFTERLYRVRTKKKYKP